MLRQLTTMIIVSTLLASCASRPSIKLAVDAKPVEILKQEVAQPREELTRACADPVDLMGYQGLTAGPVERLWFVDRMGLSDCRDRKAALQKFYAERDAALAGSK